MPIPGFNSNLVLPPHLGDPRRPAELSPYPCTAVELCRRFATSPARITILDGLLRLRKALRLHGMTSGFQWIAGSFTEDIETSESRDPQDIDVVTFYWYTDPLFNYSFRTAFPQSVDRNRIKADYHVDHFMVDTLFRPEATVEQTRYWYGLFSHKRSDLWKGMLRLELDTEVDDIAALASLSQMSGPAGVTP